jgi:hypothetical protein
MDGTACANSFDCEVHRDREPRQDLQHRLGDTGVLVVERLEKLQRAHGVQGMGAGVAFFRRRAHAGLGLRLRLCFGHLGVDHLVMLLSHG